MKILRSFATLLSLIICVTCIAPSVSALTFTPASGTDDNGNEIPLDLYSEAVCMMNLDTGEIFVDINAEEERVPASLTKIMTACIVLDEFDGDEEKLKSTKISAGNEAFDELYGTGASTADIQPYEEVSYYDLLAALMLPSSCEAANIIAVNIGGSLTGFSDLMNEKAEELGMENSNFSNAHGLFAESNYTSCKDIAILCRYLLNEYTVFKDIVAMTEYTMSATDYHPDGTNIYNTNYLLNSSTIYYDSRVKGIKTGTLDEAGRCLASYASDEGCNYITVTMGAPMEKTEEDTKLGEEDSTSVYANDTVYYNLLDHITLYDWAFDSLVSTDFIDPNSEVTEATVEFGSNADYVNLKPAEGYTRLWPDTISVDDVERTITVKDNIVAPIVEGDVLGTLTLTYKGEEIASIDLVATSSVQRSETAAKAAVAKAFPSSKEFKYALFIIIMIAVIYGVGYFIYVQLKYMKK